MMKVLDATGGHIFRLCSLRVLLPSEPLFMRQCPPTVAAASLLQLYRTLWECKTFVRMTATWIDIDLIPRA